MDMFNGPFLPIRKENILNLLSKSVATITATEISNVRHMFDSLSNMFDGFQSTHLRTSEFPSCGAYVSPEEPFVTDPGNSEKYVDGQVVLEHVPLTGQFIKLRNVLKGFLEMSGVLSTILEFVDKVNSDQSGKVENLMQASLWQDKILPLFHSKTVLPVSSTLTIMKPTRSWGVTQVCTV